MRVLLALAVLSMTTGCYYGHLAKGQARVLMARRPIAEVLADPETEPEIAHKLELVLAARDEARALGLEVDEQYMSYVAWSEDRIITTVVSTPAGRIDPAGFWFPIVGTVPYKGYFDPERAQKEADRLARKGHDTCLFAIDAYSTLGWMDDPVTEPMLARGDGALVETIVHEFVHATFFVKSQPDFNEGAAQFVGEEASIRFHAGDPDASRHERARIDDRRRIALALIEFREQIAALYEDQALREDAGETFDALAERGAIETQMRVRLGALDLETRDSGRLAERTRLNDACLALKGTYASDLPLHRLRFDSMHGDLPRYVEDLKEAARSDDPHGTFFSAGAD